MRKAHQPHIRPHELDSEDFASSMEARMSQINANHRGDSPEQEQHWIASTRTHSECSSSSRKRMTSNNLLFLFPYACVMSAFLSTVGNLAGKLMFVPNGPWILAQIGRGYVWYVIRIIAVAVMFTSNSMAVKYYAEALLQLSAFQATSICYVLNFSFTGFTGFCVLREPFSWRWVFGCALMLLGVGLLQQRKRAP